MEKKQNMKELERVLKALANVRRLEIVRYLHREKEATVGEIAEKIKLSFTATSKHLRLLYAVDIVDKEQRGLEINYRLAANIHPIVKLVSNSRE